MSDAALSTLPIILLAAGQSSRMRGGDKLLEPIDGVPLLRRQSEMACTVTSGPVLVALPPAPHPRYQCLDALGVNRVPVAGANEGINASIRAAVIALPPDAPAAMILLADLPDLTKDDLDTVFESVDLTSKAAVWRGTTAGGQPGHPIVFSAEFFPALMALDGDSGARAVVINAEDRVKLIRLPDRHARRDLDTPEDWAVWRAERGKTEAN